MGLRLAARITGVLGLAALVTAAASPSVAPAQSASPSAGPSLGIEAWLDRPVPTDPAPGSIVRIGVTLWFPAQRGLVPAQAVSLWWRPASGDGAPSQAVLNADWNGHGVADLVVPAGGAGRLEVGFHGTVCDNDGCQPHDTFFPIAGIGPPPDAPLPLIARAEIEPPTAIVAGRDADVGIVLRPRADWPADVFALPDRLVLQARIPRGPTVVNAPARLVDRTSRRYLATVNLPDPGPYILEAASSPDATGADLFATSLVTVTVQPAGEATGPPAPGTPTASSQADLLPLALVAIAVLIVGALVFVVRREA
jgi:hypothetical protein